MWLLVCSWGNYRNVCMVVATNINSGSLDLAASGPHKITKASADVAGWNIVCTAICGACDLPYFKLGCCSGA